MYEYKIFLSKNYIFGACILSISFHSYNICYGINKKIGHRNINSGLSQQLKPIIK